MYKNSIKNIKSTCPKAVDLFQFNNNISNYIKYLIQNKKVSGSFRVINLSIIDRQVMLWKRQLPDVKPYYAVKCNPDPLHRPKRKMRQNKWLKENNIIYIS